MQGTHEEGTRCAMGDFSCGGEAMKMLYYRRSLIVVFFDDGFVVEPVDGV